MSGQSPSNNGPKPMAGWVTILVTISVFCAIVLVLGTILHTAGYVRLYQTKSQPPPLGRRVSDTLPMSSAEAWESLDSLSPAVLNSRPPPPMYGDDYRPPKYSKTHDEGEGGDVMVVARPEPAHLHHSTQMC
ncbi:hypothetical protein BV22DRAFT_1192564 [Leucogyrophana mollusca]|uniref:Uncharacterized protein n=1 Tax=Leucogyrophana mollusca TaxID=85980 RepID=A0ACB8BV83_9AGAM|nr:hypothetical protein BV22DRAFT_1192564 [Leucogyrophana mollusca]